MGRGGDIRRILGKQVMKNTTQNTPKNKKTKKIQKYHPIGTKKQPKTNKIHQNAGRQWQTYTIVTLKSTNKHTKNRQQAEQTKQKHTKTMKNK
jgi:hypothetical protein